MKPKHTKIWEHEQWVWNGFATIAIARSDQTSQEVQWDVDAMAKVCQYNGCTRGCYGNLCIIHKPRRPIPKLGTQGKKTRNAVAKWKRTQSSNHEGYFICFYCGKWIQYLEAEHKLSKTRHPGKRTDPNNLVPTCDDCNREKASNDYGFIRSWSSPAQAVNWATKEQI